MERSEIESTIESKMNDLRFGLYKLFNDVLYYSSDDCADIESDGRDFRVAYIAGGGIQVVECVTHKRFLRSPRENFDYLLQITEKENDNKKLTYCVSSLPQIRLAVKAAKKYLNEHFASKKIELDRALNEIKEIESILN